MLPKRHKKQSKSTRTDEKLEAENKVFLKLKSVLNNKNQTTMKTDNDNKQNPITWTEEESKLFIRYGNCFVPQREAQHEIICNLLTYKRKNKASLYRPLLW